MYFFFHKRFLKCNRYWCEYIVFLGNPSVWCAAWVGSWAIRLDGSKFPKETQCVVTTLHLWLCCQSHTDSQLRLVLERYSSTLGAPRQRRLDSFFKAVCVFIKFYCCIIFICKKWFYFCFQLKPAPIKRSSSRLNNALANLRGDHVAVTSSPQSSSSSSRKRKTTSNKNATKKKKKTQEIDDDIDEFIIDNHDIVNSNQNSGKKLNSKPRQKLNNDNNSNRKSRKLLKTKIHTTQSTKRTRPSKPRKAKKKQ